MKVTLSLRSDGGGERRLILQDYVVDLHRSFDAIVMAGNVITDAHRWKLPENVTLPERSRGSSLRRSSAAC
jgi:hypothetical protein